MYKLMILKEVLQNDTRDIYTIQTHNRTTLWYGVASFTRDNKIMVFEGNSNGENDSVMSYYDFLLNYDFELISE